MSKIYKIKKNKKSIKKKSLKKKSLKKKSINKKYKKSKKNINRFNGGSTESQFQFDNKRIALFFDNEKNNFNKSKIICPNVINIKVNDNSIHNPLLFRHDTILSDVNTIFKSDVNYSKFINQDGDKLIFFDKDSGIPTLHLEKILEIVNQETTITDIILDFDRTFTMVEGLFASVKLSGNAKLVLNKKQTDPDNDAETNLFLNLIMGGEDRKTAMKNLLLKCIEKNIKITILTNNDLPLRKPELIPDVIKLVLEINDVSMIDIITTKSKSLPQVSKYKRINEKTICNQNTLKESIDVIIKQLEQIPGLIIIK
jgi:hypothetical protein